MNDTQQTKATTAKLTTKQVREALLGFVDTVSQKDGVFTVRRGYFYRHGGSAEALATRVRTALPGVEVLDQGEKYADFRGGQTVAKGSHWWVKFRVAPAPVQPA